MDIAKHDRATAALSVDLDRYDNTAAVRKRARELAANVFARMQGKRDIDITLRLGEVCPFTTRQDRALWVEEIARLEAEGCRRGVR